MSVMTRQKKKKRVVSLTVHFATMRKGPATLNLEASRASRVGDETGDAVVAVTRQTRDIVAEPGPIHAASCSCTFVSPSKGSTVRDIGGYGGAFACAVGELVKIRVQLADCYGNEGLAPDPATVAGLLKMRLTRNDGGDDSAAGKPLTSEFGAGSDGATPEASFSFSAKGAYQLVVTCEGGPIKGSPFAWHANE